jgi:hypothetical protein
MVRPVVFQRHSVVIIRGLDIAVVPPVPGPFLGQPFALPVEFELVAVTVLMADGNPAQTVSEPGSVCIPAGSGKDTANAGGIERQRLF